jgi:hypothetical protein
MDWPKLWMKIWWNQSIYLTLKHKVLFMQENQTSLDALQDIKQMMERSSRFISLSGWSGISAGLAALAGAFIANSRMAYYIPSNQQSDYSLRGMAVNQSSYYDLLIELIAIAIGVFVIAFVTAFFFTYRRSVSKNTPIWNSVSQRMVWNALLPILVGGIVILRVLYLESYTLVAPLCLIFYGLALLNASKYTLGEIRWLGYAQIVLGLINLWNPGWGLVCWSIGFGVMHIVYGFIMWWKYERAD